MSLMQSPPGAYTQIDGRKYLYFVGTGYLGLQGHPEVIRAACEAAQQYGLGSANSRTAFGTTQPLLDVERRAAEFFGADDAFYFASGWMGNGVLAQLIAARNPLVLIDECSHYSLFEASRLTGGPIVKFQHRDPDDLRAKLQANLRPGQCPAVLSDGVFAATGRIAPVSAYSEIVGDYPGAAIWLDDAHGLAVLGENGRGTFEHAGLWNRGVNQEQAEHGEQGRAGGEGQASLFFCGTLSKAFGGFGGIVPGGRAFVERIKRSPCFGGASSPPAPIAAGTARAIELVVAEPGMRRRLLSNSRRLKEGLRRMGLAVDDSPTPICCLVVGNAGNMQRIQRELMDRGIAVAYMAAYSGLGPEGGLRIAAFAAHTEAMIQQLLDELQKLL